MKTSATAAPPPPAAVDPGKSSLDYINAMADPALQGKLLASEQAFRPQYNELNLQDLQQYLLGSNGTPGALDMFNQSSISSANTQSQANRIQREADINDVSQLGGLASQAFQNANPQLQAQMRSAQGLQDGGDPFASLRARLSPQGGGPLMDSINQQALGANGLGAVGRTLDARAQQLAQSTGQMTPDELRAMQQDIRGAYTARGTELSNGAISAESLGRLTNERQNQQNDLTMAAALNQANQGELGANRLFQQDVQGYNDSQYQQGTANLGMLGQLDASMLGMNRNYALQLAQMQAAIASDPFQAILGRQSGALQYGAGQQGFAGNMTQSMQGPQLFDPDMGINLALQNSANQSNYQASVFGAQAAERGARAGARGAIISGAFQGLGNAIGCWVARECYGNENPKWVIFRHWLLNIGPKWFRNLYLRHGERFAAFISDKPNLKRIIRRWMDGRIASIS